MSATSYLYLAWGCAAIVGPAASAPPVPRVVVVAIAKFRPQWVRIGDTSRARTPRGELSG
jgi:hypothetical protein